MRFLLVIMVLGAHCAAAPDSLLTAILEVVNDTERVNRLYQRGFFLKNNDPALASEYALFCLSAAEKSGSLRHLAKAHSLKGVLLYRKGLLDQARKEHELALDLRIKCHDRTGMAISQTNLGNIFTDQRQYEKAESAYLQAVDIHTQNKDNYRLSLCLVNLGTLKQTQNLLAAAEGYYRLAQARAEEGNDYETRSLCLNNLAVMKAATGDYDQAMALHQDALKLRLLMEDQLGEADSYLNLCDLATRTNELTAAAAYLDKAEQLCNHLDYFDGKKEALRVKADFYKVTGDFKKAFIALERFHEVNDSLLNGVEKNESEHPELIFASANPPLKNSGLLAIVLLISVIIPLIVLGYKR